MPCKSMTGFGQSAIASERLDVKVEIRTVNHRFAEFNIRVPREFAQLEDQVRARLASRISRGRTDVFITIESHGEPHVEVAWPLLDALLRVEREAMARYRQVTEAGGVERWLNHPDVLSVQADVLVADDVAPHLLAAVDAALDHLTQMRSREGERLAKDMAEKLQRLRDLVSRMSARAAVLPDLYRERLSRRIEETVAGRIDETRIAAEIVLFADRAAIDEELVRLRSHIEEFVAALEQDGPVGRRLDFIVQELHREVNTIGSKSVDLDISKAVVDAKVIIEQLREQAQNVE